MRLSEPKNPKKWRNLGPVEKVGVICRSFGAWPIFVYTWGSATLHPRHLVDPSGLIRLLCAIRVTLCPEQLQDGLDQAFHIVARCFDINSQTVFTHRFRGDGSNACRSSA